MLAAVLMFVGVSRAGLRADKIVNPHRGSIVAKQKPPGFSGRFSLWPAYWPPVNRRDHHPARRGAGSPAGSGAG
jgi:hypothetical protein